MSPPPPPRKRLALVAERSISPLPQPAAAKEQTIKDVLIEIRDTVRALDARQAAMDGRLSTLEAGQAALRKRVGLMQVATNAVSAAGASAPQWVPLVLDALSRLGG